MEKSAKDLKQRAHWEWMKVLGRTSYLLQTILMSIGSFTVVELVHLLCSKFGWLNPPTLTSIEDLLVTAVLTGGALGQIYWSDMKRKFDTLPPGEDWTMK